MIVKYLFLIKYMLLYFFTFFINEQVAAFAIYYFYLFNAFSVRR
jgi:hypothetical protein